MGRQKSNPATYAGAGVDVAAGKRAVSLFKEHVRSTFRPEVVGDIGGFGGAFAFDPSRFKDPLLVSGTDGVGTKVMIAQQMDIHSTIGIDLVAMSVNDVVSHAAEPLFFLDYIVTDKLHASVVSEIVKGIAAGCRDAGCALIGGEVAEHPGHFPHASYDLAGFCVGAVEREHLVTGEAISVGDSILGIESSGLHSNGYSLVRRVLLEDMGLQLDDKPIGLGSTLGEELLRPTTIYATAILALCAEVRVAGLAHITGGGLPENLERVLPPSTSAVIDPQTWDRPAIFELISSLGRVEEKEMFATFNMGVGMVVIVPSDSSNHALDVIRSHGYRVHEIGIIEDTRKDEVKVKIG